MNVAKAALDLMVTEAKEHGLDADAVARASSALSAIPLPVVIVGEHQAQDVVFSVGVLVGQLLAQLPDQAADTLSAGMNAGHKMAMLVRAELAERSN